MKFGVPELEDLGDVDGRSVLVRADFNVPIRDGVITDDLRIRAALPTLQLAHRAGGEGHRLHPPGPPQGRAGPRVLRGAGACPPGRAGAGCGAARQPALRSRARPRTTRGSWSASWPVTTCTSTTPSGRRTGRTRRSWARRARLPSAAGRLLAKEVEVLLGLRGAPGPPLRGHHRWRQGERQAGGDPGPARHRRRRAHRRRDVLHLLQGHGPPDRQLAVRGRPGRRVRARCWRSSATGSTCPRTWSASGPVGRSATPGPGERCGTSAGPSPTAGWAWTSAPAQPPPSAT